MQMDTDASPAGIFGGKQTQPSRRMDAPRHSIQEDGQAVHSVQCSGHPSGATPQGDPLHEVDVTTPAQAPPLQQLLDRDLLLRLMKRTGQGDSVDVRKLASRAGLARGTVGDLVSGARSRVTYETAAAVCAAIGVDMDILFATVGRSLSFVSQPQGTTDMAVGA